MNHVCRMKTKLWAKISMSGSHQTQGGDVEDRERDGVTSWTLI